MVLGACSQPEAPRTHVVLVGAGTGTASVNAFFPSTLRIKAGDTVVWRMNAHGDPHTVTFAEDLDTVQDIIPSRDSRFEIEFDPRLVNPSRAPGGPVETHHEPGFFNSGIFFGAIPDVPRLDSYALRFDAPGEYLYVCAIHEFMRGTVVVEPRRGTPPLQNEKEYEETIVSQLEEPLALVRYNQQLAATGRDPEAEELPGGTKIWIVKVGIGPREAEVVEFLPRVLTIQTGDTVVWTSSGFHAVVFDGDGPRTQFYLPDLTSANRARVGANPDVMETHRPGSAYEGDGFVSSGIIGPHVRGYGVRPAGSAFVMTFPKAGIYRYSCPIHAAVGMVGVIRVEERQ